MEPDTPHHSQPHPTAAQTRRAAFNTLATLGALGAAALAATACAGGAAPRTAPGQQGSPTPARANHEVDLPIEERHGAAPGTPPEFFFEPTGLAIRPGVYDLWCGPHEFLGMAMRLVVGEATRPGAVPPTDFSPRGTTLAAGAVLSDPALASERILQRGRVSWTELDPASKRLPPGLALG